MSNERLAEDASELAWFKSSHSSSEGGACVEVAADADAVHVRDSKDTHGPQLTFASPEWGTFIAELSLRG